MWQQILDLPVIVQGALGSALFWVVFEALRRGINVAINIFAKFNSNTQRELTTYEAMYHARCMFDASSSGFTAAYVLSIHLAFRRFLYSMIYICLGLISSYFVQGLAVVAYMIAAFHLFMALRAVKTTWGGETQKDEHKKRFEELMNVVNKQS